jgi:hypothetical protein
MEQCVHESWTTNGMEKLETRRQPQRFPRSTLGGKAGGMVRPLGNACQRPGNQAGHRMFRWHAALLRNT